MERSLDCGHGPSVCARKKASTQDTKDHSWTVAADTEHVSPWAHGCPWGLAVRQPDSCLRILLGRLVGFLSKGIESTSGNRGGETRKLWPPFLSAGKISHPVEQLSL